MEMVDGWFLSLAYEPPKHPTQTWKEKRQLRTYCILLSWDRSTRAEAGTRSKDISLFPGIWLANSHIFDPFPD
jgi:hypothetical protein